MTDINLDTHKQCNGKHGCKEVLLRSHFTNDSSKKDGKKGICRKCQRAYRQAHLSQRLAADKAYRDRPENRFKKYKASAESRGFTWGLTHDEFMIHWQVPCTHCGDDIETIGLDRVDSSKPYQPDNVEPCCRKCNQMKSDWNTSDWYEHMTKIITQRLKG